LREAAKWHAVARRLPAELAPQLKAWIDHPEFRYLADVVNCSKHRRLIRTGYGVSLIDSDSKVYGLQFEAFEKDGREYGARWVEDFPPSRPMKSMG
jgi:hypothetical protein